MKCLLEARLCHKYGKPFRYSRSLQRELRFQVKQSANNGNNAKGHFRKLCGNH